MFLGDINIDVLNKKPAMIKLSSTLNECGYSLIDKVLPTHGSSLIDISFVKGFSINDMQHYNVLQVPYSDHFMVSFKIKKLRTKKAALPFVYRYDWKSVDETLIINKLLHLNNAVSELSFLEYFNCLNSIIKELGPRTPPYQSNARHLWISDYFINLFNQRDRCLARSKFDSSFISRYKVLKNKCTMLGRQLKIQRLNNRIDKLNFVYSPNQSWQILNNIIGKSSASNESYALDIGGDRIYDPLLLANAFNIYIRLVRRIYSRPVPKPYDNPQSKFTVVVSGLTRQESTSSNILFFKQLCTYFPN